jgi:hypothetical protein
MTRIRSAACFCTIADAVRGIVPIKIEQRSQILADAKIAGTKTGLTCYSSVVASRDKRSETPPMFAQNSTPTFTQDSGRLETRQVLASRLS